jgi:hypothetical protein
MIGKPSLFIRVEELCDKPPTFQIVGLGIRGYLDEL